MSILRNKRIFAIVGIISIFLGVILPYYTFSIWGFSETVSLWGYLEGKIILTLNLINALFIFKDIIEKYMPKLFNSNIGQKVSNIKNTKLSIIPIILIIIFVIYLNSKIDASVFDRGIGFYLLWIGIVAMALHSFIYKGSANNLENKTNEINNNSVDNINQNNIQANVKYCPNCGNVLNINDTSCSKCMFKF